MKIKTFLNEIIKKNFENDLGVHILNVFSIREEYPEITFQYKDGILKASYTNYSSTKQVPDELIERILNSTIEGLSTNQVSCTAYI